MFFRNSAEGICGRDAGRRDQSEPITPYSHTFLGVAPGTLANGTSTHSALSGAGTELAPQLIGTSGNITLSNATTLKFIDWPAAILSD